MNKRRYFKRSIAVVCSVVVIAIVLLMILNAAIYDSLENNLEQKLVQADQQRVYALGKQFSVFSTTMEGISSSIKQMDRDGVWENEVKLRILLADLCNQLGATIMGICDETGDSVIGVDIDFEVHTGIKKAFETGKSNIVFSDKGPQGEQECLMFNVPIVDKNGDSYVLYATIARRLMSNVFNASTTYKNQNIMVVQREYGNEENPIQVILPMNNRVLQETMMSNVGDVMKQDREDSDKITKDFHKNGYFVERREFPGLPEQYVVVVPLEGMPWYLVTAVPTSETDIYINSATDKVVLLFGIMLWLFVSCIALIMYLQYRNQSQVFSLAYYDGKTGLYNWDYMQMKIAEKEKTFTDMCIAVFDVRGLKYINELYGFHEGDRIIREMAEYFRNHKISDDIFSMYCKLSDDSFGIVLGTDVNDELINAIKKFVSKLKKKISNSFEVKVSAAIAHLEKNKDGNYQLSLDNANRAMEIVKKKQDIIGIYNQELRDEELRQKKLEGDLAEAIRDRDLVVYYQPKYDAKKEILVGAEALVRWNHKEWGFLPPGQFIPIFENNGMIGKIDMYVLEEVCKYIQELKRKGIKPPVISVNLSRAEINDRNLVKKIKKLRKKYDVESDLIEIEITESSMNNNENRLIEISEELHNAGFGLAIDDFGTGYSSFAQLIKMPLDTIKLDKSFLDSYAVEGRGSNVHVFICDVIQIAKHIDCKVVAEGVETKDQRDMLAEADCDMIQGYYYGKPMPVAEFSARLQ
ncbi:MAG: GGDEF domain-containing protein [Lachnospiraceae bacterium]|nr:GGDEF domain-containing protein [Lachnospiraceae bacterium]